jgi:hypothetical protein
LAHLDDVAHEKPDIQPLAPNIACTGHKTVKDRKGRSFTVPYSYSCPDPHNESTNRRNDTARDTHDAAMKAAQKAVDEAVAELDKAGDVTTANSDAAEAKAADIRIRAESVMHRAAAAWFGVDTADLTTTQFQTFKKWALIGLAGSTATATMLAGLVIGMAERDGRGSKLTRALRAYIARRRKKLVRIVETIVEKPVDKLVEVDKLVFVDKPTIVDRIVEKPFTHEKLVEVEKHVLVDRPTVVEKTVEKPVIVEKPIVVPRFATGFTPSPPAASKSILATPGAGKFVARTREGGPSSLAI